MPSALPCAASYHAWADLNSQPMTTQGTINFAAGRSVTETIYYNQATGVVEVRVWRNAVQRGCLVAMTGAR
jgi:hypothetical protein